MFKTYIWGMPKIGHSKQLALGSELQGMLIENKCFKNKTFPVGCTMHHNYYDYGGAKIPLNKNRQK